MDETWLLCDGHWWTPGGNDLFLVVVVFVDRPMIVLIVVCLVHQLEQVRESMLGDAVPFLIV